LHEPLFHFVDRRALLHSCHIPSTKPPRGALMIVAASSTTVGNVLQSNAAGIV
jgi:hypothetical protein